MYMVYIFRSASLIANRSAKSPQTRAPPTFVHPLHKRTLYAAYTFPVVGLRKPRNRKEWRSYHVPSAGNLYTESDCVYTCVYAAE